MTHLYLTVAPALAFWLLSGFWFKYYYVNLENEQKQSLESQGRWGKNEGKPYIFLILLVSSTSFYVILTNSIDAKTVRNLFETIAAIALLLFAVFLLVFGKSFSSSPHELRSSFCYFLFASPCIVILQWVFI